MISLNEIANDPKQKHTFILPDGTATNVTLEYKSQQMGWFITELTYGSFALNGFRIVTSPNMLHQFRNQLPFGLACFVTDDQEPTLVDDFAQKRAQLFILTSDEVALFGEVLSGQVTA